MYGCSGYSAVLQLFARKPGNEADLKAEIEINT
jgi:hypothetical protein